MAAFPWSRDTVVQGLREQLLVPGAVTAGFIGLDVVPGTPRRPAGNGAPADLGVTVLFRWRHDPATYAIEVPTAVEILPAAREDHRGSSLPKEVSTGPGASLHAWVGEVAVWLMEELDTGLIRRAVRTQIGDVVVLTAGAHTTGVVPAGYQLGEVYVGPRSGYGRHLAGVGLDVTGARQLIAQDRLVEWLHAHVDNPRGEPFVGHAVVSRERADAHAGSARLEVLEVVPGTSSAVTAALAFNAARGAIEAGASTVFTDLDDPALHQVGFRRDEHAALSAHPSCT